MQFDLISGKQVLAEELLISIRKLIVSKREQNRKLGFALLKTLDQELSPKEARSDSLEPIETAKLVPVMVYSIEAMLDRIRNRLLALSFKKLVEFDDHENEGNKVKTEQEMQEELRKSKERVMEGVKKALRNVEICAVELVDYEPKKHNEIEIEELDGDVVAQCMDLKVPEFVTVDILASGKSKF